METRRRGDPAALLQARDGLRHRTLSGKFIPTWADHRRHTEQGHADGSKWAGLTGYHG